MLDIIPLLTEARDDGTPCFDVVAAWAHVETAYARLQSLRPETLTPALADSPIGLASWFIEKF